MKERKTVAVSIKGVGYNRPPGTELGLNLAGLGLAGIESWLIYSFITCVAILFSPHPFLSDFNESTATASFLVSVSSVVCLLLVGLLGSDSTVLF